ncbi:unnamed protein product [Adineta steineri]|uniref:NAD(+)--protein-arginine ADP-ribosyltransferase n=1 Tax=Adineta steineri TaxID=433720 RepID=A0A819WU08_9BILA|nr:unnamed protein product [Adineta steineri]CAF4131681.1 unnamed protein product [Adineta steineri]
MQRESSFECPINTTNDFSKNRQRNAENLSLIWCDVPISENENRDMFIEQFQKIFNDVHIFDNIDRSIDYLTDIKDEFIFFIITDSPIVSNNIEQILDQFRHIHHLYIFKKEDTINQSELDFRKHRKLKGIFSSITTICEQLRKDVKRCEHDLISFDVVSNNNSINDEQEANFMYAQLVKEYLLDIANNENNDTTEMIDYCRQQYTDNRHELIRIDELEKNYNNHSPIWWYTQDGFIYKMLNKALRLQDIETLYAMRLFTNELHKQLVYLHNQQQNNSTSLTSFNNNNNILYRGQQMFSDEFIKIKNNQGGLLSFNSFLSTSNNKDLAIIFAGNNSLLDENKTPVLFKINIINNSNDISPFANISEFSVFGEGENEVLFSMGTVFRIENVTQQHSDGDFWLVQLTLTNANDPQLIELTRYMREQVKHANPRDRLYNLLIHIGKYTQAQSFFQSTLKKVKDSDKKSQAALHHQLGFLYHEMGNLEKAMMEYEESLAIKLSYLSENDSELSLTLANMSCIYRELGHLDLALTYIQRALHIDQHHSNDEIILASRFHCMGMILYSQNKINEAIEQFEKALAIWTCHLPSTHPSIAESLNNLATIYYGQEHYDQALNIYQKCLDIETKSLPTGHPSLAITYNNIAYTYYHKEQYQQALEHSLKAIELSTHAPGDQHPNTQTFRDTFETIHQKLI